MLAACPVGAGRVGVLRLSDLVQPADQRLHLRLAGSHTPKAAVNGQDICAGRAAFDLQKLPDRGRCVLARK